MTNKTIEDFGRRDLDFKTPKVVDVLPEYFRQDHPQLIELLEAYMDFLDSDGGINDDLRNILKARDIGSVSLEFLNFLLEETGLGLTTGQVADPRTIAQNFPDYFRYKGSLFSAKYFFRMLYGEEAEISYPKDQLFIVGESEIGPESLKFIQNGALYQVLSILVKSSQPISVWREQFKRFVHPAGFYLGGEVLAEGIVNLNLNIMPTVVLDSDAGEISLVGVADVGLEAVSDPLTLLLTSPNEAEPYRVNTNKPMERFKDVTLATLQLQYGSIYELSTANPFDFSDSDSDGIDFSNTIETMDQSPHDST